MCKFKSRSSVKQYIKNKPIKWDFKYWYRCDSETGYVYQLELYQERKEKRELNLSLSVVPDLCHIACVKWYGNKSIMLLGSHLEEITSISTVQIRSKGSSSKIPVNYPNDAKLYNCKMDGDDLMDQLESAYRLDGKLNFRFCLRVFFAFFLCAMLLLSILL